MSREEIAELKQQLIDIQKELDEVKVERAKKTGKQIGAVLAEKHVGGFLLMISILTGIIGGLMLWASVGDSTFLFIGIMLLMIAVSIALNALQISMYYDETNLLKRIRAYGVITGTSITLLGLGMGVMYWTINLPFSIIGFCVTLIGGLVEELAKKITP